MAQTGNFTPILLYASPTPGNIPAVGSLTNSANGAETAINYADGRLFYKNASNVVTQIADRTWIGTVTSVSGTSPVAVATGTSTPVVSLSAGYGDTQNPYASKTANNFLAAPNGAPGVPTFRAIVAADIPTLNQNTTGSAATLTTARNLWGQSFNGSADISAPLYPAVGSVSLPAYSASGDTNTGIFFPAADTIGFTEGGVEALRINPNSQLTSGIAGTAALPSFSRTGDENTGIFFPAADTIAFAEGGVESMRITGVGALVVGATSAPIGIGASVQAVNGGGIGQYSAGSGFTSQTYTFGRDNVNTGNFVFALNGAVISSINSATGVYTPISNINKKKDLEDSNLGLDVVLKLKPKFFRMAVDEENKDKELGFIAQDVYPVLPQACVGFDLENSNFIGLNDRPFIAVLTKAIQELNNKIETQAIEILALKANK